MNEKNLPAATLAMPSSLKIVDPNTGRLTHEWEVKIKALLDTINNINQAKAQG